VRGVYRRREGGLDEGSNRWGLVGEARWQMGRGFGLDPWIGVARRKGCVASMDAGGAWSAGMRPLSLLRPWSGPEVGRRAPAAPIRWVSLWAGQSFPGPTIAPAPCQGSGSLPSERSPNHSRGVYRRLFRRGPRPRPLEPFAAIGLGPVRPGWPQMAQKGSARGPAMRGVPRRRGTGSEN